MDWVNGFNALVGDSFAHVGWAQMSVRAIIIFAYGLVITRVGAWRAFGRWSTPDIVVAIIVGSNLSRALTAGAALIPTIVATTIFLAAWWVISFAASRSDWLDWLFKGEPIRLITDGSLDREAMHRRWSAGATSKRGFAKEAWPSRSESSPPFSSATEPSPLSVTRTCNEGRGHQSGTGGRSRPLRTNVTWRYGGFEVHRRLGVGEMAFDASRAWGRRKDSRDCDQRGNGKVGHEVVANNHVYAPRPRHALQCRT